MSSSTKFEVNPSSGLYVNAQKLNQSNSRKMEFSGTVHAPKLIRPGEFHKDLTSQRPGNSRNLAEHEHKFYQAWGVLLWGSSNKFEVNLASYMWRNTHKPINQRQTNSRNWTEHHSGLKSSLMISPTKFEVNLISYSTAIHGNCSTNQMPGNGKNSAENDHPPPP